MSENDKNVMSLADLDASARSGADCHPRRNVRIVSDLPVRLPITAEEIGLLRAFLSEEIFAILRGEN